MSFTLGYFNRLKRKKTFSTNAAKKRKEVEVILIGRRFSERREIGPHDEQRPQGNQREGAFMTLASWCREVV